jgi:hypothetical protein
MGDQRQLPKRQKPPAQIPLARSNISEPRTLTKTAPLLPLHVTKDDEAVSISSSSPFRASLLALSKRHLDQILTTSVMTPPQTQSPLPGFHKAFSSLPFLLRPRILLVVVFLLTMVLI